MILVITAINSFGQVGIGTTTPLGALDITATTDGLVIPRVALTISTSALPLTAPTTSELVYNTATIADVTPGYYYWDGATWVRLASASIVETDPQVSSATNTRIPKWNGTTLVDGIVTDTGSRVGVNSTVPAGSLDISYPVGFPDGLLIPRVALTGTASALPLTFPTTSEMVYNNVTISDVTPGYYYWNGSSWLRLATANTGWLTTGNTGIVDGTNFIGTAAGTNVDVAFRRNNTAAGKIGTSNTSFGLNAGTALIGTSNTSIGVRALTGLSSSASISNTAVGFEALSATTGSTVTDCTAIGFQAGENVTSINNTAVGSFALFGSSISERNTAVGKSSMEQQSGSDNTAVGFRTLFNGSGTNNVAIGNQAGEIHSIGSNCTMVGFQASANGLTNATAIGFQAVAPSNNSVRLGNGSVLAINGNVNFTASSDRRLKDNIKDSQLGLNFIKTLRPVSYFRKNDVNKKTEYGFIAQELEEDFKAAGDPNNAVISKDNDGMLGVRYNDFISISVKAIQEQQELIEALQKSNAALLKANVAILERLERLEKK